LSKQRVLFVYAKELAKKVTMQTEYTQKYIHQHNFHIRNPLKRKAVKVAYVAKRNGELVYKECEVCGLEKSEAHHDDYTKPNTVRFLCKKHHVEFHMNHEYSGETHSYQPKCKIKEFHERKYVTFNVYSKPRKNKPKDKEHKVFIPLLKEVIKDKDKTVIENLKRMREEFERSNRL
jgi:hypothetical protein